MGITVPSATSASAAEVDAVTDVATAPDPGNGRESVGSLSWSKFDENGDLLEGAEFKVTGPNGYEKTIVDNGDLDIDGHGGRFSVDQLPEGDYSVKEIKAPTG